jgi:hypothetical protein
MQRFYVKKKSRRSQIKINYGGGYGGLVVFIPTCWDVLLIQGCGGGGSVRRRNTLHLVGGRQIIICHKRGLRGEREFLFYRNKIEI